MLFKSVFVAYLMVCLAAIMGILWGGCDARHSTEVMSVMRAYTEGQVEAKTEACTRGTTTATTTAG